MRALLGNQGADTFKQKLPLPVLNYEYREISEKAPCMDCLRSAFRG